MFICIYVLYICVCAVWNDSVYICCSTRTQRGLLVVVMMMELLLNFVCVYIYVYVCSSKHVCMQVLKLLFNAGADVNVTDTVSSE